MAVNLQSELERLYGVNQQQQEGLTDRLNKLDAYSGQVNPEIRKQVLDFSNRPAGYNPLQDIQTALDISERSRDARTAVSDDLTRTQASGMDLLSQIQELAKQQAEQSPTDKLLEALKLESAKQQIKDGKLRFNLKTGELETNDTPQVSDASQSVINLVDQLLGKDTKPITGALKVGAMIPGNKAKQTQALYDQLKGLLSLQNRTQLKGSGAISDFESKMLEKASSSLNQDLSDEDFRATLEALKADLSSGGVVGSGAKQNTNTKTKTGGKKADRLEIL